MHEEVRELVVRRSRPLGSLCLGGKDGGGLVACRGYGDAELFRDECGLLEDVVVFAEDLRPWRACLVSVAVNGGAEVVDAVLEEGEVRLEGTQMSYGKVHIAARLHIAS